MVTVVNHKEQRDRAVRHREGCRAEHIGREVLQFIILVGNPFSLHLDAFLRGYLVE